MKTWAKIGIGCLVVILAACVISAIALIFAGKQIRSWVNGLTGGAGDMAANVKAIQKLDEQYPFTEPADGQVTEDRLKAYIAVCAKVKPVMEPYAGWIKSHQQNRDQKGNWGDVKKAMTMTAQLTAAMKVGLEENKMGPKEFHWIENAMRQALLEAGYATGGGGDDAQQKMIRDSIKDYQEKLANPSLTPEEKAGLQEQLDKLKAQEAEAAGGSGEVSQNRKLFEKYAAELKANDLQEYGGLTVK